MALPAEDRGALLHPDDAILEGPATCHRDYVLQDYAPACDPVGRLHPVVLFRHVLRMKGLLDAVWPVAQALRDFLGPEQTVWGFKEDRAGRFGLEFYLYRNQGSEDAARKSVRALRAQLEGLVEVPSTLDESLAYFMLSLELDADRLAAGEAEGFRVYVAGDRRRLGYDGLSYLVRGDELLLENHYCFYRGEGELGALRERLASLPRSGDAASQRGLLPPHLVACHSICQATKRHFDGLYFSRIPTAVLGRFLNEQLPGAAADLVAARSQDFAHLLWDVGIDYAVPLEGSGRSEVLKAGVYGVL